MNRSLHDLVIGKTGLASKTITFRKSEFKKELAPTNAKIEELEINGEKVVRMHYTL